MKLWVNLIFYTTNSGLMLLIPLDIPEWTLGEWTQSCIQKRSPMKSQSEHSVNEPFPEWVLGEWTYLAFKEVLKWTLGEWILPKVNSRWMNHSCCWFPVQTLGVKITRIQFQSVSLKQDVHKWILGESILSCIQRSPKVKKKLTLGEWTLPRVNPLWMNPILH